MKFTFFSDKLKLFRLFGVTTYLHWTFIFWLALLALVQSSNIFWMIVVAFASVTLHEYGHIVAAQHYGFKVKDVVLYPFGGAASILDFDNNVKPVKEIVIALAGPAVNIILVGLALVIMMAGFQSGMEEFLIINASLAIFNLLPAFPMDGGRVLRAILSNFYGYKKGTRIACVVGIVFFGLLLILAIFNKLLMLGIIAILLGLYCWNEYKKLSK